MTVNYFEHLRLQVEKHLYERPGTWMTTRQLLDLIDSAEDAEELSKVLSYMVQAGRLQRGPKLTVSYSTRQVNTWQLADKRRYAIDFARSGAEEKAAATAPEETEADPDLEEAEAWRDQPRLGEAPELRQEAWHDQPRLGEAPELRQGKTEDLSELIDGVAKSLGLGGRLAEINAAVAEDLAAQAWRVGPGHFEAMVERGEVAQHDHGGGCGGACPCRAKGERRDGEGEAVAGELLEIEIEGEADDDSRALLVPDLPDAWEPWQLRLDLLNKYDDGARVTLKVTPDWRVGEDHGGVGTHFKVKGFFPSCSADFIPLISRCLEEIMRRWLPAPGSDLTLTETATNWRPEGLDVPRPYLGETPEEGAAERARMGGLA